MVKFQITNSKSQINPDYRNPCDLKHLVIRTSDIIWNLNILAVASLCYLCFGICHYSFAQEPATAQQPADLELNLDINSKTVPLPKIYSPNIDLSGRGYHKDITWPYHIAAAQVLDKWGAEMGFKGIFRLHWNFWELEQASKNVALYNQMVFHYETIIKNISKSGGTVIVSLYGTPPGKGEVLDKRSPPANLKQWKQLVKNTMRYLSCEKRYNIWYEVWDAPDTDNFFLGDKKDYLSLYRMAAEAVRELNKEKRQRRNNIKIRIGGPAVTWWFQNIEGNSIFTPEKSLIYELIQYCRNYKLPLDFISWHAYGTDPSADKESTTYNKTPVQLIRDWLAYFRFDRNPPLIIDEWNYDSGFNILEERAGKSYICASYIPARLKNMYEAGIDYQVYFCLEDFQGDDKDSINSNRGVFYYDSESPEYKGEAKSIYNVLIMLSLLGEAQYSSLNLKDEFIGVLATRRDDDIMLLVWNYIDPDIGRSFLTRSVASLHEKGRINLTNIVKSRKLDDILRQSVFMDEFSVDDKLKGLLTKAIELNHLASSSQNTPRNIKITLSNIKGTYTYQRYTVDDSCSTVYCPFVPIEEKQLQIDSTHQEILSVKPYSVSLLVFKKTAGAAALEQ